MKKFAKRRPSLQTAMLATVAAVAMIGAAPARADEVTPERLLNAEKEPGNWLHHHKNFSATRFSTLSEINKGNVKNLKVAWTMHLGGVEGGGIWTHGGLEGTPIVENGMMYVTDGWGSVYKIDAHGGKGVLLWKMDPKTDHDWAGAVACCGVDNRGVALWGNLVISHTLDGRLIATNKETGQVAWQRQVADPEQGRGHHRRAADRQEHGHHRRSRRGIRHPRLDRGDRSQHRRRKSGAPTRSPARASPAATPGRTTRTLPRAAAVRHG